MQSNIGAVGDGGGGSLIEEAWDEEAEHAGDKMVRGRRVGGRAGAGGNEDFEDAQRRLEIA
jgi:hypothetical protein